MRTVFMGTASFAVPTLERLVGDAHPVTAVITQADKPSGRGRLIHFSPIKVKAQELDLRLDQPASLEADAVRSLFEELEPEIVVVVAYGKLIPPWLIELPQYGVINLHGSLLPRYRGAAPVNWVIANGETHTGVCTMQIDEGLDTGPLFMCRQTSIGPEENAVELSARLAMMGSALMLETMGRIREGVRPVSQDHSLASRAPLLRKHHGFLDWTASAQSIHNKIRGFVPWPGAVARFRGKLCKFGRSRLVGQLVSGLEPGAIVRIQESLQVCCGDSRLLEILELQLESRKPQSGLSFAHGARLKENEKFGPME